jgi:hypothetical protein
MTSTASSYDEPYRSPTSLTQAMIEQLDEQTITELLVARFRAFVGNGYPVNEALLAAVGSLNTV